MSKEFSLVACAPVSSSPTLHCGPEVDNYLASAQNYARTPEGAQLRKVRREKKLTLGAAASLLGLRAVDLSGLEIGRLTMNEADWSRCFETIKNA